GAGGLAAVAVEAAERFGDERLLDLLHRRERAAAQAERRAVLLRRWGLVERLIGSLAQRFLDGLVGLDLVGHVLDQPVQLGLVRWDEGELLMVRQLAGVVGEARRD